ncbi:methyltransferase [Schaalia sp. ZJ1691]|uniref:class I SAM-dependent methyltransferase n=1 Tax=Schaalia sp. ZJ1691 TaxID=2709404 RepID=UPI0013EA4EF9|nr:methyltransferase [Schaalia sp. ZJ1691]
MEDQYFADQAPADESDLRLLFIESRGHDLQMQVSSKVFSSHRLDLGTRQLLAQAPQLPASGRFLDLGCGWGPLAVTMAAESPGAQVWAVDVNSRAVDLTQRNAQTNDCPNVRSMLAETALAMARTQDVRFDVIWSNPPVRVGKESMHEMLTSWIDLLTPDGAAYLVVQRNLGADSLISWLNTNGYAAKKIASKKGYRIIEVCLTHGE